MAMLKLLPPRRPGGHRRKDERGRQMVTNRVRMYAMGAGGGIVRFILTHDILERLMQLRDGASFKLIDHRGMRVIFTTTANYNMPACLLQLEPPTFDPRGQRVSAVNDGPARGGIRGNRFNVHYRGRALNLRPGLPPMELDTLWLEGLKGVLLIFPDWTMADKTDLVTDTDAIIKEALN